MHKHRIDNYARRASQQRGFTLIELMIGVVVIAVLIALALPNFRETSIRTKVASNTNDLIGAISLARLEAVKRGVPVAVIANAGSGSSNWGSSGWYVQASSYDTSTPPNVVFNGGASYLVRQYGALSDGYKVTSNAATIASCTSACTANGQIVFSATGALQGATKIDLNVCRPDQKSTYDNHVVIQQSGMASSYRDIAGSPAPSC